jgi:D-sedoheptulose 7-phosphate isomerase
MISHTRRSFLQTSAAAFAAPALPRPNVLWIMSDQFRADCLGATGNRLVRTPNLDRLAARSANFLNAFVQAPVCVPSRISFFTGRYPHCHKNRVNYTPCDPREVMISRLFQQAGYQTGSVGKLHYTPATADHARFTGFDHVQLDDRVNFCDRYSDYVKWRGTRDPQAKINYNAIVKNPAPGANPFRARIDYEFTPTAWTGDQSCSMLRELASSPKPFFLFSSFFKPHSPHTVAAPYDSLYNGVEILLPPPCTPDEIHRLPLPLQKQILRGKPEYDMDRARLEWVYRSYYGGVSMVDREAGRILDELHRGGGLGGCGSERHAPGPLATFADSPESSAGMNRRLDRFMNFAEAYKSDLLKAIETIDLGRVQQAIDLFKEARANGKHIFVCGNGGSASTASHFVTDMVKGASYNREPRFRIMALTDSLPTITAYLNDVSYNCVFVEPLKNFAQPGDLVVGISGSGNSPNVLRAIEYANSIGCHTIALTGRDGGRLGSLAAHNIQVAVPHMGRIEDAHLIVFHTICYYFMDTEK